MKKTLADKAREHGIEVMQMPARYAIDIRSADDKRGGAACYHCGHPGFEHAAGCPIPENEALDAEQAKAGER